MNIQDSTVLVTGANRGIGKAFAHALPLADDRRAEVLNAAGAKEWFPGWVSKPLKDDADAQEGIALLRQSYDELHAQ